MRTLTGDLVTPNAVLTGGTLMMDEAGHIAEVLPQSMSLPRPDLDLSGFLILPGFIDMHVHGGGGADFMHGTPDAVRQAARTHARFGTTSLLATTLTESRDRIDAAVRSVRVVMDEGRQPAEARLLGIHLEGPYICPARRGAQPAAHVRLPDVEELRHWITLSRSAVRQITLAPEMPGAEAVIHLASMAGIVVSIGHTDATATDVERAIGEGARQGTHLFNAMRGIHHREPGTAGAILMHPALVAEVIADGVHLDPRIVQLIVQVKGTAGIVLITDAMEGTAMPDGEYELGGFPVQVHDGTAQFADGTLAGSVLTMNHAFRNVCRFAALSPVEAARLTSANAARQLGEDRTLGTLEAGKAADIVALHPETGQVECTLVDGQIAYRR